MSHSLDPVIQHRLAALGRRWQRLVLLRGLGGTLATLLGALILLALLDWLVLLPDWLRWVLSLAAYGATLTVFWFVAGRFLVHAPGPRELARLAESADPRLRENLLSAVELAENEARWDSPAFRHLLQQSVSNRVRELNDEKVLPRRIVLRWVIAGVASVGLCIGLWLVPGLQFSRMFARAAAPAANIERVSRMKIAILSPGPQTSVAPRGDAIPVIINVTGGTAQTATIEVFRSGKSVERVAMLPSAPGQFTGALMADEARLEYRVRAGDAITRRYSLQTRPRPHVVQFEKVYKFPDYTRMATRHVAEETGDLAAFEGTQMDLTLQVDQPVKAGTIQLQFGAGGSQIPLVAAGTNKLAARFPLNLPGTYRVKLIASATGFENALSPQYEIKISPDMVPRVELLEPGRDLLVPADEQLRIVGRAEDDIGLASITQSSRVNGGPWIDTPLPLVTTTPNLRTVVTQQWDLAPLKARPGDQIVTKLVATDLKGNRSETPPAKVTIASAGIDLRRLQAVEARRRLQSAVGELSKALRELDRSSTDANKRSGQGELKSGQARLGLVPQVDETERLAETALARLSSALPKVRGGREASDLTAAGIALANIRHDLFPALRGELAGFDLAATNGPVPTKEWQAVLNPIRRATSLANSLESALASLLAAEQLDVASESTAFLFSEQQRLTQRAGRTASDDRGAWSELQRRFEGNSRETKSLEEQIQTWSGSFSGNLANRVKKAAATLGTARAAVEKSLGSLKQSRDVTPLLTSFQKSLGALAAEISAVKNDASQAADRARDGLHQAALGSADSLNSLVVASQPATKGRKTSIDSDEALERAWTSAAAQLKARTGFEEARPDADSQLVADLGRAAEAVTALQSAHGSIDGISAAAQPLSQIDRALRLLLAARRFTETTSGLRELANQERWEISNPTSSSARPRDWRWLKARWSALPKETKGAELDPSIEARVKEAASSTLAGEVTREMDGRMTRRGQPASTAPQLDQLLAMLEDAARNLAATLAPARDAIAQTAPTMSQRMEALARKAEMTEKQTAAHRQKSEQMDLPANQAKATELLAKQEQLTRQIDDVRAALRREANAQDLLNAEGREKARDADDADALLKEPPHKAVDRLRDAVGAEAMNDQTRSLAEANAEQTKTTQALKQLAEHFKNTEMGNATASRAQLRQAEEELGMKSLLDQRYSAAAALAELSKLSPEEQMAKLEEKLKDSKPMQEELSAIMKDALQSAGNLLSQAAEDEKAVADRLHGADSRLASQTAMAAQQIKSLQAEAARLAKDDVPQAMEASMTAQAAAEDGFLGAGKSLKTAAEVPAPKGTERSELAKQLAGVAAPLNEAADSLRDAAKTTAQAAKRAPSDPDAQKAKSRTAKAAALTANLAEQAKSLQQTLAQPSDAAAKALADARVNQEPIGKSASAASESLQKASRHDTRMNPVKAFEMMNLSANVEMLAKGQLPKARQELDAAATPAAAEPTARTAQQQIDAAANAVQAALGMGKQGQDGQSQNGKPGDADAQEGKQMARALDQLDSAMNQQQKNGDAQPSGQKQTAQQAAQQAMNNLAQAQQEAAKNSRQQQQAKNSEGSGAEGYYAAKGEAAGELPQAVKAGGEWGKLPPQLARELMEAQRDSSGGEYRSMIDTYFKVVAEKARTAAP